LLPFEFCEINFYNVLLFLGWVLVHLVFIAISFSVSGGLKDKASKCSSSHSLLDLFCLRLLGLAVCGLRGLCLAKQVLSAGFDYATEKNGIMLFRRPKRFSKVCV